MDITNAEMLSEHSQALLESFLAQRSPPSDLKHAIRTQGFKVRVQGVVLGIPTFKTGMHRWPSVDHRDRTDPYFADHDGLSIQFDCKDEYVDRS